MKDTPRYDSDSVVGSGDSVVVVFFFQAEDGIRDLTVTGVQTCALPICGVPSASPRAQHGPWQSSTGSRDALGTPPPSSRWCPGGTPSNSSTTRPPPQIGRASCRERV